MTKKPISIMDAWDNGLSIPKPPPRTRTPEEADAGEVENPWDDAPFVPLGKAGKTFYFLDAAGDLIDYPDNRFGQWTTVVTLCGGNRDWPKRYWRATDKDGNPVDDFIAKKAGASIIKKSSELPAFNPATPIRSYGTWKFGTAGIALHLGDTVVINGERRRAGFLEQSAIWVRLPPKPRPGWPSDARHGAEFESLLNKWNWTDARSGAVLFGLITAGALSGLLPWRPHGLVVGEKGTGKSTLLAMLPKFCPLIVYQNDYTEPGLRRMLSDMSSAVILDEAEADAGGDGRLTKVIEMLRRSSSGEGVAKVQGGEGYSAKHFNFMATAILGCTLPPPLPPADASRFTILRLNKLDSTGGDVELLEFLETHGLELWARALDQAPRMLRLFSRLRARLVEQGSERREADQLGIIAACRWVMVEEADRDPAPDDIAGLDVPLKIIRGLVDTDADKLTESAGAQAFQRLAMTSCESPHEKITIGRALHKLRNTTDLAVIEKYDAMLQYMGVRWATHPLKADHLNPAPPFGLYVSVTPNPRLLKTFEGTSVANGRWGEALRGLPDVVSGRMLPKVRIDRLDNRCVWISERTIDLLVGIERDAS